MASEPECVRSITAYDRCVVHDHSYFAWSGVQQCDAAPRPRVPEPPPRGPLPPELAGAMLHDRRLRTAVHEVIACIEDAKRPEYEDVAVVLRYFGVRVEAG